MSSYDFAGATGDAGGPFVAGEHPAAAGVAIQQQSGQGHGAFGVVSHSRDTTVYTAHHSAKIRLTDTASIVGNALVINLYLRTTQTTGNGYMVQWDMAAGVSRICRSDGWTDVALGADIAVTFTDGDDISGDIVNDTVTMYKNGTPIGSRSDGTYSAPGFAQLLIYNSVAAYVDDYLADNITPPALNSLAWIRA